MGLLNDFEQLITPDTGENSYSVQDFQRDGFIVPPVPTADGNGLPSQKIKSQRLGRMTRQVAHWFVPEVGIVPMKINPQSINYNNKKLIDRQRTKGGYIVQYWGEELTTLDIKGHTGSAGVEGLNVLYEIYRAEQYMFDSIALTMAADSSITRINDLVSSALGNIGGLGGSLLGGLSNAVGLTTGGSQSVLPKDVPSLAAMATGIELYFAGWVFRGYFENMSFNEDVSQLGLWNYNISFVVTQRRGYRVNGFPWQRSALDDFRNGGSTSDTPLSYVELDGTQQIGR